MMAKYKKMMVVFIVYVMGMIINIHACLTTFINDNSAKMIIYNKIDKTIIPICKNEKRRFGNHQKHASFVIYMQQPKMRFFTRVYTCKQNECGDSGNVQLKFSDIKNGVSDVTALFTITKHKPYASMVQELLGGEAGDKCDVCGDE